MEMTTDLFCNLVALPHKTTSGFVVVFQSEQPGVVSSTSSYHNFSQAQQREATEAVKASVGYKRYHAPIFYVNVRNFARLFAVF